MKSMAMIWAGLLCSIAQAAEPAPLPTQEQVHQALLATPAVQSALSMASYENASARRLDAGPYEWTVRAGYAQRNEINVAHYNEADIGIERGLRWWWKGATDHKIGESGLAVADAAIADAWHEEARTLVTQWFDLLRAQSIAENLQRQLMLFEEQVRDVTVRVNKGETRPLDLTLSNTEIEIARARLIQAQREANLARTTFALRYPSLVQPDLPSLPPPLAPDKSAAAWTQEIVGHNHEIELARAEAARAQLNADRARQERLPDPTVGTRYSYERDGKERLLGFSVSLPIGTSSRAATADQLQAKAAEAAQRVREVQRKLDTAARTVSLDADARYNVWQSLEQVATNASRNAEALGHGYQLGEATFAEMLLARRQASETALSSVQARADAWQASTRLRLDAHELWAYTNHHAKADGGTPPLPPKD